MVEIIQYKARGRQKKKEKRQKEDTGFQDVKIQDTESSAATEGLI